MVPGWVRSAAVAALIALLAGGCSAPEHPDPSRYEYRYMNGDFAAPYTAFPDGRERGEWQCYDANVKRAFDCTYVTRGWDRYQFIFRKRR
jgi:hypothetical protein